MFLDSYQSKSFYEAHETNNINSCSNNLSPLICIFYVSFNHKFKLYSICDTNVFCAIIRHLHQIISEKSRNIGSFFADQW